MKAVWNTWGWFRQPMSGFTHLLAAIAAALGLIWIHKNTHSGTDLLKVLPLSVFVLSMVFLFLASALYHLLPVSEKSVLRLRKLDHSAIYVFIAGSYTPVCLTLLKDSSGPVVLWFVWALAVIGVLLKLLWMESSRWLRVGLYFSLTLVSIFILPEMVSKLPADGIAWLFIGFGVYGLGAIVYALKWPDPFPEFFGFHEVWHVFVMGGCFCHFWLMKEYMPLS